MAAINWLVWGRLGSRACDQWTKSWFSTRTVSSSHFCLLPNWIPPVSLLPSSLSRRNSFLFRNDRMWVNFSRFFSFLFFIEIRCSVNMAMRYGSRKEFIWKPFQLFLKRKQLFLTFHWLSLISEQYKNKGNIHRFASFHRNFSEAEKPGPDYSEWQNNSQH